MCTISLSMSVFHPLAFTLLKLIRIKVIGEVAFSRRYGFVETGTDVDGTIKFIDDVQWYDGVMGQIPEFDKFFRTNPILPYLMALPFEFLRPKMPQLTLMALEEVQKRKQKGNYVSDRRDLLGQLMDAHGEHPEQFSEADVFSIAHGAM